MKVLQQPFFTHFSGLYAVLLVVYSKIKLDFSYFGIAKLTERFLMVGLWITFGSLPATQLFLKIIGFQSSFLLLHPETLSQLWRACRYFSILRHRSYFFEALAALAASGGCQSLRISLYQPCRCSTEYIWLALIG